MSAAKKRALLLLRPRCCSECGAPYYRANRLRVWTSTNPGHRLGWIKEDLRLCIRCFDSRKAQRVVTLASVRVTVGK